MFSRGNATSGAPICSGMISLANPTNSGVANSSSMIVPCMVNSSLYCESDTMWLSGPNSWALMIMAISPATMKKPNDVIRYRWPMILWSVVDSQLASNDPLREPPGPAPGPACTGRAKVVTGYPKRLLPDVCTTPAQALIGIAGLPPAHTLGRRNGMHIPSRGPPGRTCGQSLNQRYNAQHHTRQ